MSKVLIITTSLSKNGNGDAIAKIVSNSSKATGANVNQIALRDKHVEPFSFNQAEDDFNQILSAVQESDALIVISPSTSICLVHRQLHF